MRFHYISPSTLPSKAANSVHVVWQSEGLCRCGADVTLYAKRLMPDAGQLPSALRSAYGVEQSTVRLDTVYSRSALGDSFRIAQHAVRAIRRTGSGDAILSRNLYAAFALAVIHRTPLLFETHQLENGFRKWMQRQVVRCPWVTTVLISDHLSDYLTQHLGVSPRRSLVLHDAAPEGIIPIPLGERRRKLSFLEPKAVGSWRLVCGYFGHLYSGRGMDIIAAIAAATSGGGILCSRAIMKGGMSANARILRRR